MAFQRNPNQQDLSWFVDMQAQQRLELSPPYQRKSVWTYKDKQFFLDTVFNNFPCPAIYLQKENTPKGPIYNVVDGKQRLSTVLDFHAGRIRIGKHFNIARLRGKKFSEIDDEDRSHFYNYIFMVEQIRSETEVDWGEVFERVNKNQKKLGDQELRHARFDGWLINRAESEAERTFWSEIGISSQAKSARMKDVEFLSVLMLVLLEHDFVGFPQSSIDDLYAKYDFDIKELPESDFEIVPGEGEDDPEWDFTKAKLDEFEKTFGVCVEKLIEMEKHNKCISTYRRRIATDLYSLWAALALDQDVQSLASDELAKKYSDFMGKVYAAIEATRKTEPLDGFDDEVKDYYFNSVGAATESEQRSKRHSALITALKK